VKLLGRKQIFYILFLFCAVCNGQLRFGSLDSLLNYANRQSATVKIGSQQTLLAKWTKVAALANAVNFRSPVSFSATDNLLLPVNFIPSDAFGGPAGTFRQITLGQEYVSNFNFNPQIDLINPANWAKIKSAEVNKELTEVNNQLARKVLHESIAAAWHNCVSIQEQVLLTEKSAVASDSVMMIVKNRFQMGLVREQDLNNATVNGLLVSDRLQQLKTSYEQQLNSLRILCDIPQGTSVIITDEAPEATVAPDPASTLLFRQSALQGDYAKSELKATRCSMLPVLSFVYYQGWQKNSNISFTDAAAPWIQSKYIGLRLTVPFPPDVAKLSQSYTSKINYRIASVNTEHLKLQNDLNNKNLEMEMNRSAQSFAISRQVYELKKNNYEKSLNQYREGVLSTDLLLTAFNDLLNSGLSMASAKALQGFNRSKININNSFK
jgi:outer membrane protein